jgi:hypothetical protein
VGLGLLVGYDGVVWKGYKSSARGGWATLANLTLTYDTGLNPVLLWKRFSPPLTPPCVCLCMYVCCAVVGCNVNYWLEELGMTVHNDAVLRTAYHKYGQDSESSLQGPNKPSSPPPLPPLSVCP